MVLSQIGDLSSSYGVEASSTLCLKLFFDRILRHKLVKIKDKTSAIQFEHSLVISAIVCLRMIMKHREDQDRLYYPMGVPDIANQQDTGSELVKIN